MNTSPSLSCRRTRQLGRLGNGLALATLLVLGLVSTPPGFAQAPTPSDPTDSPPRDTLPGAAPKTLPASGDAPNPLASWKAVLATAKAAEEGDADLPAASDQYVSIVRLFDTLRPVAAEALFRYAVVEARREHVDESQAAHARLIQWFPDFPDYVRQSLAIRGGAPSAQNVSTGAPGTGGASLPGGTHGGAPAGPVATPTLSPELMRRYGLGPTQPGAEPAPPTTFRMTPALMARYGLSSAPSVAQAPEPTAIPADPVHDRRLADMLRERTELAAETSRTASDLRKARLEKSRVGTEHPQNIPPNLISDARLRALIEQLYQARATLSGDDRERTLREQMDRLEEYHHGVYLRRLDRTVEILERELDTLKVEMDKLDMGIAKLSEEARSTRAIR